MVTGSVGTYQKNVISNKKKKKIKIIILIIKLTNSSFKVISVGDNPFLWITLSNAEATVKDFNIVSGSSW